MKKIIIYFLLSSKLFAYTPSELKIKSVYGSLDPTSITQHLAFYDLYHNHALGKKALNDVYILLDSANCSPSLFLDANTLNAFVSLINKQTEDLPKLSDREISLIESSAKHLKNRKLEGYYCKTEDEVINLPPEKIDLAHGLLLSQLGEKNFNEIRTYEAMLDIMALQIQVRLPKSPTAQETIRTINQLIFEEMGFKFPPHSLSTEEIDKYSYLHSVLNSNRGVCLGVSIIYLGIAQRLGFPLEIITPPGHIYVRYNDGKKIINIETTARGVHYDCEHYLSIDTYRLQLRNIKEVIGMAHFNAASSYWKTQNFEKAYQAYLKAKFYMEGDPILKEFIGYILLLKGEKEAGEKLLKENQNLESPYCITQDTLSEDYFAYNITPESIKILYMQPEDNRSAYLKHKEALEQVVAKYPKFRTALMHLAMTWIKLHRYREAREVLYKYYEIDTNQPEVNYYLSALAQMRSDFPKAWMHLKKAEKFVHSKGYYPKTLVDLRRELLTNCPE